MIDIAHAPLASIFMAPRSFFLCTLLTFSLSFHRISDAGPTPKYVVVNLDPQHGGGIKFENVIGGVPYTKSLIAKINKYLWSTIFKQNKPADRKPVDTVTVYIKNFVGGEGVTMGDVINISAVYLNDYNGPMELKWEFTSLMYHEVTHVFQWFPPGTPIPVIEGIADYTILKANYYPPGFNKPGSGVRWDQGYDFTARFFEYCDSLVPDFVAKLNNMMRTKYDVSYFQNITGKPVEQLWKDYKAKYARKTDLEGIQGKN